MTTDTQLAPTDAEIVALIDKEMREYSIGAYAGHGSTRNQLEHFARAVLAKCGTPAPVGVEPAQWQKRHPLRTNGEWKNTNEHDAKWWRDNSQGWEIRALYTTPQPVEREPLTPAQREAIWEACKYDDGEKWTVDCGDVIYVVERMHNIKGDQHGTE